MQAHQCSEVEVKPGAPMAGELMRVGYFLHRQIEDGMVRAVEEAAAPAPAPACPSPVASRSASIGSIAFQQARFQLSD